MLKEAPDHHDADLVLKIYDLRREAVMRESRSAINTKYWPRTEAEAVAVVAADHPLNTAFRKAASPRSFRNAEWVVLNCTAGQVLMEGYRARVKRILEAPR